MRYQNLRALAKVEVGGFLEPWGHNQMSTTKLYFITILQLLCYGTALTLLVLSICLLLRSFNKSLKSFVRIIKNTCDTLEV